MNSENDKICLPTNIKQIGSIPDNFRIYVEDYVLTYIHQYSKECGCEERNAILLGEDYIIDGNKVLFISGVIQGKYSEAKNGMEVLTDKSWQYINEEKEKYFNNLKILGWVYIQPGYGDYINDFHINYHFKYFNEENQVLFLIDPLENINCFYKIEEDTLNPIKGYIVYYDKNPNMQDYMIENRTVKISTEDETPEGFRSSKISRPKEEAIIIDKPRSNRAKGKLLAEQKKLINLFGSLSAVLFLVCFIMGAGLVQNDDRIRKLESQLTDIDNSYRFLLNQIDATNTQSVFASDSSASSTTEPQTQATTELKEETSQPTTQTEEATTEKDESYQTYTIKEGDNLGLICRKIYGNEEKMEQILEINDMTNPDKIRIGDVIKLP